MHWRKMTWAIVIWTVLMLIWLVAGVNAASSVTATSSAEQAGVAIGTGIGASIIFSIWFVGFIVLAIVWFMSRPKVNVTVYGPAGQAVQVSEKEAQARISKGWTYKPPATPP